MGVRISLATFGAMALVSNAAAEAQTDIPPAVVAFTATPEHVAALMNAVRPYYALSPSCTPGTARRIGLDVVQPVSVNESGALSGGAWVEHVKVDGCVTSGLFNVFTLIRSGSTPLVGSLLPGSTRAPLGLQRDALPSARQIATLKLGAGCSDVHAVDTRFDGFGEIVNRDVPAGREPRSWREEWTFAGCGRSASVIVRFTPDRTGSSFIVDQ